MKMDKEFNFSTAKKVSEIPALQQLRKAYAESQDDLSSFFDDDVKKVIRQHSTPQDRVRLNAVIRALFATA